MVKKKEFKKGNKIRIKCDTPDTKGKCKNIEKYLRGVFVGYSKDREYVFFTHTHTGKILKLKSDCIE